MEESFTCLVIIVMLPILPLKEVMLIVRLLIRIVFTVVVQFIPSVHILMYIILTSHTILLKLMVEVFCGMVELILNLTPS